MNGRDGPTYPRLPEELAEEARGLDTHFTSDGVMDLVERAWAEGYDAGLEDYCEPDPEPFYNEGYD